MKHYPKLTGLEKVRKTERQYQNLYAQPMSCLCLNHLDLLIQMTAFRAPQYNEAASSFRIQMAQEGKGTLLICTDVASRGLDFKNVAWIV